MKFKKIGLLLPVLFSVFNAEGADVLIRLSGSVSANTCEIATTSHEKYVNLGRWSPKKFSAAGVKTDPVKFTIDLTNCNGSLSGIKGSMVTFSGQADSNNPNLLALSAEGDAKNIGISILNDKKQQVIPNQESSLYIIDPTSNNVSLTFYGQYVSTAAPVQAGKANADVVFSVTYQ